jgi:hypothetical protein
VNLFLARVRAAVAAFRDPAHETWVVVEEFESLHMWRIRGKFRTETASFHWGSVNAAGNWKVMTLAEYRHTAASGLEDPQTWVVIGRRTLAAWRIRDEAVTQELERITAVAKRED